MTDDNTLFSEYSFIQCPVCNLLYAGSVPSDILEHGRHCANFVEAVTYLDYKPNFHDDCEKYKYEAYALLLDSTYSCDDGISELVFAAETLITQYFDRSLHAAITRRYYKKHPILEEYTAMLIGHIHSIPKPVKDELIKLYGRVDGEIAPGCTYWFPKYSADRKLQFGSLQK